MARRRREAEAEAFFHTLVGMPWWVGPLCAAFFYVLLRFIMPTILTSTGNPDDPMAKSFGAILVPISIKLAPFAALFVLVIWGLAELKKLMDRRRLDNQTGLDSVGDLSWAEFEELVAEAYRREGYAAERTGAAAGDGGVDVILRRNGQATLVQCKHWKTWTVGVKIVRELRGVMASEKADYGIVVSYGTFTSEATSFAQHNRITLVCGKELIKLIHSVQKKRPASPATPAAAASVARPQSDPPPAQEAPACPKCGSPMVQRTAKRGPNAGSQFWGCPRYPACQGIRPC
jgi:restriction system protein